MNKKLKKSLAFLVVIATVLSVSLNSFAWPSATHSSLITSLSSSYYDCFTKVGVDYQTTTADAAKYTDTEDYMDASSILKVGSAYIISPYHAKANLSCSTVQATSYTSATKQGYSLSDVKSIASFLYGLAQTGIGGNAIDLNSTSYTTNVKKRIVLDLKQLINTKFSGTTSNYKQGYIILGVYLHLIQDIYAHRAVVTATRLSEMYNENSAVFSNYSGAKTAATTYSGIPMIRLKDYLVDNENSIFEDNSSYWTDRFSSASRATGVQVTRIYYNNSFSFSSYDISVK